MTACSTVSRCRSAKERVALLGPNGSGKTTFVLHLNGLLSLQSGTIRIGDLDMTDANLPEIRRRVGAVFQDADDQLFMQSVRDDVSFGPANLGVPRGDLDGVVERALDQVGAMPLIDRTPHHLSGGEKRRVAIATVLAMEPHALVRRAHQASTRSVVANWPSCSPACLRRSSSSPTTCRSRCRPVRDR